jgi:uncharacterized protein YgiM (DUF1202 family)
MFRPVIIGLITTFLLLVFAGSAVADEVYVKTRYAKLRSGTSSRDATISKVKHGAKLTVLETKGGFLRVKAPDGKEGWITKSWTTPELKSRSKFLEGLGAAARGGGNNDVSFTAGARGLSSQAASFAGNMPDLKAVVVSIEKLEKIEITVDELDKFLQEGQLGDYRQESAK